MRLPLPQFTPQNRDPNYIAEVIETATTEFLAQCLEPEDLNFAAMPPFGSWVKAGDEDSGNQIYAVIYHVTTSPIDSVHRARALGLSLQALREEQPQIFAMLKTEFRAAIVGYQPSSYANGSSRRTAANGTAANGLVYQHLPPRPPQVHQAVYYCDPEEIIHFSTQLDFLRTLLQVTAAPVDSLTAAAIREIYRLRQADREWLVQAGRTLSVLLKDDYDRLRTILSQIHL
jgi:HAS barrel domain